ncbi:hypothetical protein AMIS_42310 [Actinoplanes missouriensis 431]|uniref:Integral membrane protein n=1 Tax=Actinoplanes missouriensis (strain ATCC 14538 / DSM 43046 / CBS 188.64 / JCM 3121 / NBRC 102363 / NCIMB 12654 / NRRL B-3342 / UNCC 431) TaxID=512565 RepID=I0H8W4_ACTM4|nr:hypothetical protein [Actinoplanes missouriensis]BAL89451.1 hypothetical protein AMIS_42310 [Actinoplanes missouriensis 431]
MNIFLILGPALNGAATFFWQPGTQGATGGTLSGLGSAFWLIGLLGVYRQLPERHTRALIPLAVLGTAGGIAFSVQAIHEQMFGISHATAVAMLDEYPFAANTLYWFCGPLFPFSLAALGILLWRERAVPVPTAVLMVLGAAAFPLSRMSREVSIAHLADLLLLLPFLMIGVRGLRAGDERRSSQMATESE